MNSALLAAVRRIEARGAHACAAAWNCMSPELSKRLGAGSCWVGPAFASAARRSKSVRMNRVVGFAALRAPAAGDVRKLVEFFSRVGAKRFALSILETSLTPRLCDSLASEGFKAAGGTTYLARDARTQPGGRVRTSTELRIRRISRREAGTWAHIVCVTFGWPPSREPWVAAQVGLPGSEHFLACLGETPIATGQIVTHAADVWVGGAATLAEYRRHGAQGALIRHRLRRASALGCRWLAAETLIPQPGKAQGSYRNLVREGFVPVVIKRDFIYSSD